MVSDSLGTAVPSGSCSISCERVLATERPIWKKRSQIKTLFLDEGEQCYEMGAESWHSVGESGEESRGG